MAILSSSRPQVATLASQAAEYIGLGEASASDDDSDSEMARVTVPVIAGGTYYLQVSGQGGSTGDFDLDVAVNDPADAIASPLQNDLVLDPSTRSTTFDGRIALAGDSEDFRFTVPDTGELVINQTSASALFLGSITVSSSAGSVLASDNAAVGGTEPDDTIKGFSRVMLDVTAGQTYLIQVSGLAGSVGPFHLELKEFPESRNNLETEDLAQDVTPQEMVADLLGPASGSVQVVPGSISYTGAADASGLFSGGQRHSRLPRRGRRLFRHRSCPH